jgi:hypothetical protein
MDQPMIISNRYRGPRYTTDSTAHDVRSFVDSSASRIHPTPERPAGPAIGYTFDELYPALAATSTAPKAAIFAAVVRGVRAVAMALRFGRGPVAH